MRSLKAQVEALEAELADCRRQLRNVSENAAAKEAQLRLMLEASPVAVANLSSDGTVLEANSAYRRLMLNGSRGDGVPWAPGISVAQVDQPIALDVKGDATGRIADPQGSALAAPDGGVVYVADAIERRKLSDEGLRSVIELMPAVVAVFDGEFRLAAFNQQLVDHLRADLRDRVRIGTTLADMASLLMKSVIWFEGGSFGGAPYGKMSDDEIDAYVRDRAPVSIARRGSALNEYETREGRFFQSRTNAFLGGGIVRVGIDVTEERRDKQRFQEVVASLVDGMLLFDSNFRLRLWSPSVVTMFGFLEPMMTEGALADDIRAAIRSAAIETDRFEYHGFRETQHHRRYPDGRIIHFREVETQEGGLLITCSDQSDLCRALSLASRVERMESLGRLVAGVAHEIGTPLGVSVTAGSIVSEQANAAMERLRIVSAQDPGVLEPLQAVSEASSILNRSLSRASELVDSFKRVSVDELSDDYRSFRLTEILNDVATMLRPQLRLNSHELEVDCPSDIVMSGYPGAISQIVTNFVSNSLVHGFPDGRSGGRMWLQARRYRQNVEVIYRDDGVGVRPDILGRIFEHFFTTRRGSGGSGLGLGIVHNLTTDLMGGSVEAISPPEGGLQIQLSIPASIDLDADLMVRDKQSPSIERALGYAGARETPF